MICYQKLQRTRHPSRVWPHSQDDMSFLKKHLSRSSVVHRSHCSFLPLMQYNKPVCTMRKLLAPKGCNDTRIHGWVTPVSSDKDPQANFPDNFTLQNAKNRSGHFNPDTSPEFCASWKSDVWLRYWFMSADVLVPLATLWWIITPGVSKHFDWWGHSGF